MASSLNTISDIQKLEFDNPNLMLGKGLQMPFSASNSGSRKLMFGTQLEHRLPIIHPEVAFIQTGYEKKFGQKSSSYVEIGVDHDFTVIGVVPKFSWMPKHSFYVFGVDMKTKTIHVIERKEYKHTSENYGYLFNNQILDNISIGQTIPAGTVVQKSMAFDEYNNRQDGVNMLTMYSACEETMEDAIVISESAAKKLASPLVKRVTVVINDNDIPLNLYGDSETYKTFPDIGEETKNSILCALRRERKEESLFSQSYSRLRDISISDEVYTVSGRVVDIDVRCNAPQNLTDYYYNAQLKRYYDDNLRMSSDIVNVLAPYIQEGYKMDFWVERLNSIALGTLNGKQFFSERVFSNIILDIYVVEEIPVLRGDKLSNRYGGKGITSIIRPDALMPRTASGEVIDVIMNMCGVYGRENAGQLFEITVSYVCMKILSYVQLNVLDVGQAIEMYLQLLGIVAPSMVEFEQELISKMTDDEAIDYIGNISCSERSMYLVIEPITENMTIDKVNQLYEAFPWIKPEKMLMPIKDSTGALKYVPSRRPLIYGYQYIYRLKQYAEEKFSVTSLSATNTRNENSKSKNSNNHKALYSRTPIRFGDMETGNLIHLGAELVVQMLMLYSTSPNARRLTESMLTGDPFNVDVCLDMDSKNRNAEILNVYLKTMGLRLVFKRVPKKFEAPMLIDPMVFFDDPHRLEDPMFTVHPDENFDEERYIAMLLDEKNKPKWGILVDPMEFYTLDPEKYEQNIAMFNK